MLNPRNQTPMKNNITLANKECALMSRGVRKFLAEEFPETSVDIAICVLLRIVVDTCVRTGGRQYAPAVLSRLINHFLLEDHYVPDGEW